MDEPQKEFVIMLLLIGLAIMLLYLQIPINQTIRNTFLEHDNPNQNNFEIYFKMIESCNDKDDLTISVKLIDADGNTIDEETTRELWGDTRGSCHKGRLGEFSIFKNVDDPEIVKVILKPETFCRRLEEGKECFVYTGKEFVFDAPRSTSKYLSKSYPRRLWTNKETPEITLNDFSKEAK